MIVSEVKTHASLMTEIQHDLINDHGAKMLLKNKVLQNVIQ